MRKDFCHLAVYFLYVLHIYFCSSVPPYHFLYLVVFLVYHFDSLMFILKLFSSGNFGDYN